MKIEKALELLKTHNDWRRGDIEQSINPKEIGIVIDTVLEFCKKQLDTSTITEINNFIISDPDIINVVKTCYELGMASVSLFQRRLKIPYQKAVEIMDALEERKVVGEFKGNRGRELIMSEAEFLKMVNKNS